MTDNPPSNLSRPEALRVIRALAADTANIVTIVHSKARQKQRKITRRQIELCIQKGVITEEPFLNSHGNWQVTLQRLAAGEELTCVVAIDWPSKLIVITTYK